MTPPSRRLRYLVLAAAALAVVWLAVSLAMRLVTPRMAEEDVRDALYAAIQREAAESFYVTGHLDLTATVTLTNNRVLFPELLRLNVGSTRSTVRLAGRASYGFDMRALEPAHIRVAEDGTVELEIPDLVVHAVEVDLAGAEAETEAGWTRLFDGSAPRVERRALAFAQDAIRDQAEVHLRDSVQPRVNAARALAVMLTPVLTALGIDEPQIRVRLDRQIVVEPIVEATDRNGGRP